MSDDNFEKGLDLLLNNVYNAPTPSEKFRTDLFTELKERQRKKASARRSRVITLYSSLSAVAAVVVFTFIPGVNMFSNDELDFSSDIIEIASTTSSANKKSTIDSHTITTEKLVKQASVTIPQSTPTAQFASFDKSTLSSTTAHAINNIDVYSPKNGKWQAIEAGNEFAINSGVKVRTPLGSVQPVNFNIDNGPSVMLDGMSSVSVANGALKLDDGRAVVSLSDSDFPVKLELSSQDVILQPGAMVFATLDNDNNYADNGIPAPMLVLLKGNANSAGNYNSTLAQGRVYELFDTGTGRYPSRKIGSYENKREFMPMIDAIQAAYKSTK